MKIEMENLYKEKLYKFFILMVKLFNEPPIYVNKCLGVIYISYILHYTLLEKTKANVD